jgi:hypothetical protein
MPARSDLELAGQSSRRSGAAGLPNALLARVHEQRKGADRQSNYSPQSLADTFRFKRTSSSPNGAAQQSVVANAGVVGPSEAGAIKPNRTLNCGALASNNMRRHSARMQSARRSCH